MAISVRALIVAGGGAGGSRTGITGTGNQSYGCGGGGGGEFWDSLTESINLATGIHSIVVGAGQPAGGAGGVVKGGDSTAFGKTSRGGGMGGSVIASMITSASFAGAGMNGGNGGGGLARNNQRGLAGVPGNVGTTQFDGGAGANSIAAGVGAGGGAGAGAVGFPGDAFFGAITNGCNGGIGKQSNITAANLYYAGGGGGGRNYKATNEVGGTGGNGGGGTGGGALTGNPTAGDRGGGGGGAPGATSAVKTVGGKGGDGIIIIRYPGTTQLANGGTVFIGADYVTHTFSTPGTFDFEVLAGPIDGSSVVVLPALSASASLTNFLVVNADALLPSARASGTGGEPPGVTSAIMLPSLTSDSEATLFVPDAVTVAPGVVKPTPVVALNAIPVEPQMIDVGVLGGGSLVMPKLRAAATGTFIYGVTASVRIPAMKAAAVLDPQTWIVSANTLPKLRASALVTLSEREAAGAITLPLVATNGEIFVAPHVRVNAILPSIASNGEAWLDVWVNSASILPSLRAAGLGGQQGRVNLSAILPKITVAASASQPVASNVAITLPLLRSASQVWIDIEGQGNAALPRVSAAGLVDSDHPVYDPIAAIILPRLISSAQVEADIGGSVAAVLPKIESSANVAVSIGSLASLVLPKLNANSLVFQEINATADATLPRISAASLGGQSISGGAAATLPSLDFNAFLGYPYVVDSNFRLPKLRASARVALISEGSANLSLPLVSMSGEVLVDNERSLETYIVLPSFRVNGEIESGEGGSFGIFLLPSLSAQGESLVDNQRTAEASAILPLLQVTADVSMFSTGSGALTMPSLTLRARVQNGPVDDTAVFSDPNAFTSGFIGIIL